MSEVFFIGDTHFGHRGILTYEDVRAFETVDDMNQYLITEWNKVVGKKDKVFHLGDFCFGKRYLPIAGELNGRKHLVMGNHDIYAAHDYLEYFDKLSGCVHYNGMILTHIPVHPHQLDKRFWANVHGHYHSRTFDRIGKRYVNVSCENLPNMAPIPLDEVINIATELEPDEVSGND